MNPADLETSVQLILKAIQNTLNDSRGQWILKNHIDARSEFALSTPSKNLIIDRTFVDENNVRWIIDYKTSTCLEESLESFLSTEKQHYEKQLLGYSQALTVLDSRPIRVGLYFPLIPAWKEWAV